jgi:hypothetical protein
MWWSLSEGLGVGPASYDKALLMMMAMASGRVVYHLSKYVYMDDVTRLYSLACLVDHYSKENMLGGVVSLPAISWVVQRFDFQRDHVNMEEDYGGDGERDTATLVARWLTERNNEKGDPDVAQYNFTCRAVRNVFPVHSAYLVPSATSKNTQDAILLAMTPPWLMNEQYVSAMVRLGNEVRSTKARTIAGEGTRAMNGEEVAALIAALVPAANDRMEIAGDMAVNAILMKRAEILAGELDKYAKGLNLPMADVDVRGLLLEKYRELERTLYTGITGGAMAGSISGLLRTAYEATVLSVQVENAEASDAACSMVMATALEVGRREIASMEERGYVGQQQVAAIGQLMMDEYDRGAIGPATEARRKSMEMAVKMMVVDAKKTDIPRKRVTWLVGAVFVSIICHVCMSYTTNIGAKMAATIGGLFFLVEMAAIATIGLIICTMFGTPIITFEQLLLVASNIKKFSVVVLGLIVAIVICWYVLLVVVSWTRTMSKKRSTAIEVARNIALSQVGNTANGIYLMVVPDEAGCEGSAKEIMTACDKQSVVVLGVITTKKSVDIGPGDTTVCITVRMRSPTGQLPPKQLCNTTLLAMISDTMKQTTFFPSMYKETTDGSTISMTTNRFVCIDGGAQCAASTLHKKYNV